MTVPIASDRLVHLDGVRGIAALLVVVHHALVLLPPPLPRETMVLLGMSPLAPLVVGQPIVILFFVLSGYGLHIALERPFHVFTYAVRRLYRLWIPLTAAVALSAGLALAFGGRGNGEGFAEWVPRVLWNRPEDSDFPLFLMHLAGTGQLSHEGLNTVIWSLALELRLSLAMPAIVWALRRAPTLALLASVILGLLAEAALLGLVPGVAPRLAFGDGLFLIDDWTGSMLATIAVLPAFTLGGWLAARRRSLTDKPLKRGCFALAALVAFLLFGLPSVTVSSLGAGLIIALATAGPALRAALSGPLARALGALSYSLYLVHFPVLHAAANLAGDLPPPLALTIGAAAAFAIAGLFRIVVEKPTLDLVRRIGRRGVVRQIRG